MIYYKKHEQKTGEIYEINFIMWMTMFKLHLN